MIKEIYSKRDGKCYGDKSIQKMNGVLGRKGKGRVAMSCKWVVREVPTEKGPCSSRWKERDGGKHGRNLNDVKFSRQREWQVPCS